MCGFGFWSHDIGGFEGPPDAAVFKRWIAFGLLSSHSRLHGHRSYRVPWLFDDESVDVLRKFLALKHHLPRAPVHARRRPPRRSGVLLRRRRRLLRAAGRWTDLLRGNVVDGPRWMREQHGFDSVPLLVRPGAVIALGARDDRPDYDYAAGVTLRMYEPHDGARTTTSVPALTGDAGATFTISRRGRELHVDRTGSPAPWRVLLVGRRGLTASSGALTSTPDGALVALEPGASRAIIELDDPTTSSQ